MFDEGNIDPLVVAFPFGQTYTLNIKKQNPKIVNSCFSKSKSELQLVAPKASAVCVVTVMPRMETLALLQVVWFRLSFHHLRYVSSPMCLQRLQTVRMCVAEKKYEIV